MYNFFDIKLTLSDEEAQFLKDTNWNIEVINITNSDLVESLCKKGVIETVVYDYNGNYALYLTDIGKQLLNKI
ncbi:hypothetical protein M0Q50_05745 [bacterium]|jgi:hypothetical protein|nr:hypothetical protein [bacterium]